MLKERGITARKNCKDIWYGEINELDGQLGLRCTRTFEESSEGEGGVKGE